MSEFIKYVNNVKLNFPFDNSGNSIKVLTYHKSKGLQWKMVILNALHRDSLENRTFVEKDFAKVNVIPGDDGAVAFNLFPPAGGLSKLVSAMGILPRSCMRYHSLTAGTDRLSMVRVC